MRRESAHQKTKVYFYEKGASPMKKENIKKVVLAYSGGLDTSIIIPLSLIHI